MVSTAPPRSLPRIHGPVLRRARLESRLAEWPPVTVVRGVQGYGKTTLVAAWLEAQPLDEVTSVWVTATPGLADPDRFGDHLGRCLVTAGVISSDWSRPGPSTVGLRDLSDALLAAPHDRRFVLVVDNFHHLRDRTVLAELVGLVERHRHFHLLGCSRGRHPVEAIAAGSVEVGTIGPKELLLDSDEIAELALLMGRPLEDGDAARLHEAAGGWIAVVRLALKFIDKGDLRLGAAEEYLRTAVLPDIADRARLEYLMRFSLAERLDERLIRDLCDHPDPERLLANLEGTGMLERHDHGGQVYFGFPTLFRSVLRDAYAARQPDGAREFHRRLAGWFLSHAGDGHVAIALRHAVSGEDWQTVDQVWSEHAATLFMRHPDALRRALNAMPAKVLDARPGMSISREMLNVGAAETDRDGYKATLRTYFEASERFVGTQLDTLSLADLLFVGSGHLVGLRLLGRFAESEDFAAEVGAKIAALSTDQRAGNDRFAWFHLQRGLTQTLLGDPTAIGSYQRAWEYGVGSTAGFIPSNAAANLALTYAVRGDRERAQVWLDRRRRFDTTDLWVEHFIAVGSQVTSGLLALDRLEGAEVAAILELLGDRSAPVELWPFVAFLRAQYALHYGNPAKALTALGDTQRARDRELTNKGAAAGLLARARADLLLAGDQGQHAWQLLNTQSTHTPVTAVPLARIHFLAGDYPSARRVAVRSASDPATPIRDRVELLVLHATAALRMDDQVAAKQLIVEALEAYQATRILRTFATVSPADLAALLELAGEQFDLDDAARLATSPAVYPERILLIELTEREKSVLLALAKTASRQDIADALFVSVNTVKSQLASAYRKLGIRTREEALTKVRQLGLLRDARP
jgi:LuxR family maltose regulon positive regulatory protein